MGYLMEPFLWCVPLVAGMLHTLDCWAQCRAWAIDIAGILRAKSALPLVNS